MPNTLAKQCQMLLKQPGDHRQMAFSTLVQKGLVTDEQSY